MDQMTPFLNKTKVTKRAEGHHEHGSLGAREGMTSWGGSPGSLCSEFSCWLFECSLWAELSIPDLCLFCFK